MNNNKMKALIVANSVAYGSPSWSTEGARDKSRSWKTFLDSLTWEKVEGKTKKQTLGGFIKMAKQVRVIPVKDKKVEN
jgi:hypothetical protein